MNFGGKKTSYVSELKKNRNIFYIFDQNTKKKDYIYSL